MIHPPVVWALDVDLSSAQRLPNSPDAGTIRLVLVTLARHADVHGRGSCPSVDRLQKVADKSRRSVQRALRQLEAWQLISPAGTHPKYLTTIYNLSLRGVVHDAGRGVVHDAGRGVVHDAGGASSTTARGVVDDALRTTPDGVQEHASAREVEQLTVDEARRRARRALGKIA